jgi:hypothetical protein
MCHYTQQIHHLQSLHEPPKATHRKPLEERKPATGRNETTIEKSLIPCGEASYQVISKTSWQRVCDLHTWQWSKRAEADEAQ